jgi:hypothetical protein
VYRRVAAIDVHKKQIAVTVRTPAERGRQRRKQVREYATFYAALREMTGFLIAEQVTRGCTGHGCRRWPARHNPVRLVCLQCAVRQ